MDLLVTSLLTPTGDIADPYRSFIAKSRYARWDEERNRRETWTETVDRYVDFMLGQLKDKHDYIPEQGVVAAVRQAVLNHEVMPSMRAVMTAGAALDRSNIAGFNCSYLPLQDPRALDELLYILMNGTGVGYSVERQYTDQLPAVPDTLRASADVIVVEDSKEGWGYAFRALLEGLWQGEVHQWDLSGIRPAGARLRTFGGRASGPGPLDELFAFTVEKFHQAAGRKFRPIEVHDIACKIASVVVVGGVRRSAMISLSDLDDQEMAQAKAGEWWKDHGYRALANNSAVYYDGMRHEDFRAEWGSLVASGSGERGIFHRGAAQRQAAKYGHRSADTDYGTNPCSEIILRPFSFCNLSEVVVRPEDTVEDLERKVSLAATLGTWQSTLTDYPYLREEWRKNAEEERLLGVSLTGVFGNQNTDGSKGDGLTSLTLTDLRLTARIANEKEARRIGIPSSDAITCVKPSGTVSQLVDCESGLHTKHARFYKRRVRVDKKDPISFVMIDGGIPHEEDAYNSSAWVFTFAQRASNTALVREDVSAIEHLKIWLAYQRFWCEHKPSVTISVREHEWDEVGEWVWEHLGEISGVSFLPYSDHTYVQAPYEEITEAEYEALITQEHRVEWSDLAFYETYDQTVGSQALACSAAGGCEDVDLVTA
jgi:ribonucleoside-diphosphate reductase alpha chain